MLPVEEREGAVGEGVEGDDAGDLDGEALLALLARDALRAVPPERALLLPDGHVPELPHRGAVHLLVAEVADELPQHRVHHLGRLEPLALPDPLPVFWFGGLMCKVRGSWWVGRQTGTGKEMGMGPVGGSRMTIGSAFIWKQLDSFLGLSRE